MSNKRLERELKSLCDRRREGGFGTQDTRRRILLLLARDLDRIGFRNMLLKSLKPRHVHALVKDWQSRGLSLATQKNRMSALRWWAKHARIPGAVAKSNDHYGIGRRTYVATETKAVRLMPGKLRRVTDPYIRLSLRLQAAFGLRREEAMKFQVAYADHGDHIKLKSSWCKGGRARVVPVRTEEQRALLDEISEFVGGHPKASLIPPELRYVDQLHRYEYQTQQAELRSMHGLRHSYAQERYRELTGWECPVGGGPKRHELDLYEREIDHEARMTVSAELGHGREEITTVYLGR